MIRIYAKIGVKYMSLTHWCNTPWADYSQQDSPLEEGDDKIGGLTPFGKDVVRELNRNGIMVDLAHVSADVMRDALAVTQAPVIVSHSNAREVYNHKRNVP